jgi:hypothetical protein
VSVSWKEEQEAVLGTVAGYRQIMRNFDRTLNTVASRADVKRETDYYLASIRSVTSADEFIKNDRLYNFAMTAFGLKDMIYAKAFMRKVLAEGIDGETSFALQLSDGRFREFAEAFNFVRYGASATAFDRAQQGTVDKFVRMKLESEAGQSDEGLRLALYFQRKAPSVSSIFGLMGDAALYKVVQAALGLPAVLSGVDIDRQAGLIAAKLNIEDLKDPVKLDRFVVRFTARWQAANGSAAQPAPRIGISQSVLTTFDNSLLLSMQTLKPGGGR